MSNLSTKVVLGVSAAVGIIAYAFYRWRSSTSTNVSLMDNKKAIKGGSVEKEIVMIGIHFFCSFIFT